MRTKVSLDAHETPRGRFHIYFDSASDEGGIKGRHVVLVGEYATYRATEGSVDVFLPRKVWNSIVDLGKIEDQTPATAESEE